MAATQGRRGGHTEVPGGPRSCSGIRRAKHCPGHRVGGRVQAGPPTSAGPAGSRPAPASWAAVSEGPGHLLDPVPGDTSQARHPGVQLSSWGICRAAAGATRLPEALL